MLVLNELRTTFLEPTRKVHKPCGGRTSTFLTFRKKVLQRDNYTCMDCGSQEDLTVHHILKVHDYPQLAFILENTVCLCVKCHCKIHRGD